MNRSLFILIAGLCLFHCTQGQQRTIEGKILDSKSGTAVVAAHVIKPDSTGTYTNGEGWFRLELDDFPAVLRVSHISYGTQEITLNQVPTGLVIVRLEPLVAQIGEVQTTGQRLRILSEHMDYNLQDFAFDEEWLWMLGFLDNKSNQQRLWLANWFGDTICSIPVHRAERLYRDCFGAVHLIEGDGAFQMHYINDSIKRLYRMDYSEFLSVLSPIKAHFNNKLVYQQFLPMQEGMHTYYYGLGDTEPKFISLTRDTLEEVMQESDHVYGKAGAAMHAMMMMPDGPARAGAMMAINAKKLTKHRVVNRQVMVPAFALNDSLITLNLYKDSLICYDSAGQLAYTCSIDFHKDSLLFGYDYKIIHFITDPVGYQAYLLERKITSWTLYPLDHHSGKLEAPIPLPDYPGMQRITAQGGAVYFLYHEKKSPYFTRLYRYQM